MRRGAALLSAVLWIGSSPVALAAGPAFSLQALQTPLAQAGVSPPPVDPRNDGPTQSVIEARLLSQAKFWEDRFNENAALEALQKILRINPDNEQALFNLGRHKAKGGDIEEARLYVTRLQESDASPEIIERLLLIIRLYQDQGQLLDQARELARAGRTQEAVDRYRTIFGTTPPHGELAVEFFHTMSGLPSEWQTAVNGLMELLEENPDNRRAAFTLGEILTYREETRREGLIRLRDFLTDGAFSERAVVSYRNGLLWLGARVEDEPLYDDFLRRYPDDAAVREKLTKLLSPPLIENATALINEGYRDLYENRLDQAALAFERALREDPEDANAHAGLGLARLRQEDFAAAEASLLRAANVDPKIVPEIEDAYKAAAFWRRYHEAEAAREAGNAELAEELLFEIVDVGVADAHFAKLALARIYTDYDELDQAQALYDELLATHSTRPEVVLGLVNLLTKQGRFDEAVRMGRKLSAEEREQVGLDRVEANVLRGRAQAALDNGQVRIARQELEAAIRQMPDDPWLRLDYARLLYRVGEIRAANGVMDVLADQTPLNNESKLALAIYAVNTQKWDRAVRLLESIPAGERNSGDQRLLEEAEFSRELEIARREALAGEPVAARRILSQLQASYSSEPSMIVRIADAYALAQAPGTAVSLIRRVLLENGDEELDPETLLRVAQILAEVGEKREANDVIATLRRRSDLPDALNTQLNEMRRSSIIERTRELMDGREYSEAFETLRPLLEPGREDPIVLRLAGELHQRANFPERAFLYYAQALEFDPVDLFAINGAVGSAIQAGDIEGATQVLDPAISIMPDEPQLYFLAADIAQAAGDKFAAIQALEAAQNLQRELNRRDGAGLDGRSYQYGANTWLGSLERRLARAGYDTGQIVLTAAAPQRSTSTRSTAPRGLSVDDSLNPAPRLDERLRMRPMALEPSATESNETVEETDSIVLAQSNTQTGTEASERIRRLLRDIADEERRQQEQQQQRQQQQEPPQPRPRTPQRQQPQQPVQQQQFQQLPPQQQQFQQQQQQQNFRFQDDEPLARQPQQEVFFEEPRTRGQSRRVIPSRDNVFESSSAARFELLTAPQDPISQRLTDLRWEVDDIGSQFAGFRFRTGGEGLSQLLELKTELKYDYGVGAADPEQTRLFFQVTPIFITAGGDLTTPQEVQQFGTLGTTAGNLLTTSTTTADEFADAGIGFTAGAERGGLKGDIGLTPLGFDVINLVGGVSYTKEVAEKWFVTGEVLRRAVTDSVLSYAGANDTGTGSTFGGVTRSGGRVNVVRDFGGGGVYVAGGVLVYDGRGTDPNLYRELTGGFYLFPIQEQNRSLQIGYNTTFFQFDENRRFFTTGHGGYFSPQTFISASVPVEYRVSEGPLSYGVNGAVGIQFFEEDSEAFFPDDAALQAAALAAIATASGDADFDPSVDLDAIYAGQEEVQFSYRVGGDVTYQLAEQLEINGRVVIDNAADYTEAIGGLNLRYRFGGTGSPN